MDNLSIEEMFGKTTICKNGRRSYKGKKWSRVLWDILHPDLNCNGFHIHHKDGDKLNDNPENLQRLTRGEHARLHMIGIHRTDETKRKMSIAHIGKKFADDTKKKMSIINTGINNSQAKAVNINGQIFSTGREAAQYLNVCPSTITKRIQTNKQGYSYYKEKQCQSQ